MKWWLLYCHQALLTPPCKSQASPHVICYPHLSLTWSELPRRIPASLLSSTSLLYGTGLVFCKSLLELVFHRSIIHSLSQSTEWWILLRRRNSEPIWLRVWEWLRRKQGGERYESIIQPSQNFNFSVMVLRRKERATDVKNELPSQL